MPDNRKENQSGQKGANKLQAVKDKVERARADKDNRVSSKVAANKAGKRAASRPANLNQQRREMRLDRSYLALFCFRSYQLKSTTLGQLHLISREFLYLVR